MEEAGRARAIADISRYQVEYRNFHVAGSGMEAGKAGEMRISAVFYGACKPEEKQSRRGSSWFFICRDSFFHLTVTHHEFIDKSRHERRLFTASAGARKSTPESGWPVGPRDTKCAAAIPATAGGAGHWHGV
ncbi:protein of unknown function [Paraburkholderia dioscoreae]|uniref:Uncharacterized protein n=1 Tax=Paraburkholderia dioscoreae TaxID=2604047 RepID=A0A5Q4ZAF8_9BURK|nr:protein of unknown function [Paraburkholderia dioscoreae]